MAGLFVLAVTGGGNLSLLEEDGGAVEALASSQGTFGSAPSETFNPAALVAAASPARVNDVANYQPSPEARAVLVAAIVSGTMDAAASVSVQLQRTDASGTRSFGAPLALPTPASAAVAASLTAVDTLSPANIPRTYSVLLTSAGHTFSVPINSASFGHVDL
jgi:hypothetical protein